MPHPALGTELTDVEETGLVPKELTVQEEHRHADENIEGGGVAGPAQGGHMQGA